MRRTPISKTSSLTLPPYIEERLNNIALGDSDAVLKLRESLLETFYPAVDDRCPMCGGSGLNRFLVKGRIIEEGCDECGGTGHTERGTKAARFGAALEILCGRRSAPTDEIAEMNVSEMAAATLDGKILKE
jgi:hypothetical protein